MLVLKNASNNLTKLSLLVTHFVAAFAPAVPIPSGCGVICGASAS